MQAHLRDLEEKLIVAQQASEDAVTSHEQEVQQLNNANNPHLLRSKPSSSMLAPMAAENSRATTPTSALFAPKSPIRRISMSQATQTGKLEGKVRELEKALEQAEAEMGEVVSRMNAAQMEVAELQSERYVLHRRYLWTSTNTMNRDEAMMQSRRLQAEYLKEREKVQQLMLSPDTF
jgi:hypothetical protein